MGWGEPHMTPDVAGRDIVRLERELEDTAVDAFAFRRERDVLPSIVTRLLREPYVVNREVMPYAHSQRLTYEQAEVLRRLTEGESNE